MYDPEQITFFAKTDARGKQVPFGIKANDRTRHVYVIGKTGMGKSTLLENMAAQDIKNGNGLAFIDPHGQTAETLLDYIPEERKDDVLYFAPFDTDNPISFNVMEDVGPDKRHLVVSGLMSVFKKIWVDAWSARMEYILSNTLLALLEYPDSTLLGVNRMLSDKDYRKKVIDNITDPAVKSFWVDEFLKYNERYMQEAGDAIKNKIGQFTSNPLIRNIIGQPRSSFDIRKIMDERKIMIMNLSKGLVGEQNANLLGSMLTTRIYLAAMSRADLNAEQLKMMPNFYFYVDEFQSFANATFADILSEARKYKLNLTIAHQYIEQMEEEVRNAVFGNVGTIISFRVGPFDAEVLETVFTPKFLAPDIVNLGFAQIYLTLMIDGIGSAPFSAVTLPPIETPTNSCRDDVVAASRTKFSKKREDVQTAVHDWHALSFSDKPPYVPKHLREKADGGELPNTGENLKKYGLNGVAPKDKQNTSAEAGQSNGKQHSGQSKNGNGNGQGGPRSNNGNSDHKRNANDKNSNQYNQQRSDNQNGKPNHKAAPPKEKSLDELRSVLKDISQDGGDTKPIEKKTTGGPNTEARDEKGNLKKDPDALRSALAAALGGAVGAEAGLSTKQEEDTRSEDTTTAQSEKSRKADSEVSSITTHDKEQRAANTGKNHKAENMSASEVTDENGQPQPKRKRTRRKKKSRNQEDSAQRESAKTEAADTVERVDLSTAQKNQTDRVAKERSEETSEASTTKKSPADTDSKTDADTDAKGYDTNTATQSSLQTRNEWPDAKQASVSAVTDPVRERTQQNHDQQSEGTQSSQGVAAADTTSTAVVTTEQNNTPPSNASAARMHNDEYQTHENQQTPPHSSEPSPSNQPTPVQRREGRQLQNEMREAVQGEHATKAQTQSAETNATEKHQTQRETAQVAAEVNEHQASARSVEENTTPEVSEAVQESASTQEVENTNTKTVSVAAGAVGAAAAASGANTEQKKASASPAATQEKTAFSEYNEYAQLKNRHTADPLAPKKLERMMRVTTSDKLPLK